MVIQRKQANKPNTATSRCLFQDNRLTNTTADIKTTKPGETPSCPEGPYELAGCQNRMLKYASGTSVNNAALKTLDGVEVAIYTVTTLYHLSLGQIDYKLVPCFIRDLQIPLYYFPEYIPCLIQ